MKRSSRKWPGSGVFLVSLAACLFIPLAVCLAVWEGPYVSERSYPWDQPKREKQLPDSKKAVDSADKREVIKDKADDSLYFYTHGNIVSNTGAHALELRHLPDGIYRGSYPDYGAERMVLDVVVREGQIIEIDIVSPREGVYVRRAGGIIDRIIEKQSLRVDTVTGVTVTSKAVLGAIHNAVSKALEKRRQQDGR